MLNSTKISTTPQIHDMNVSTTVNDTVNGVYRSFIQPKITSTPLLKRDSIFATPPKNKILSPRRYSLSEIATPPRSNRRDLSKTNITGPLLTSTKYYVNVSTYEDTKSHGLASRIVQYHEEAEKERQLSTHQAKYGSPGLFPVVHLFKKKLPILEQKPRKVTIRIASPDYSRQYPQEYNRRLVEGVVNRGSPFSPNNSTSISTRSVLDALKEISRKRIHASEEYDLCEESGKRFRTMNNGEVNKRLRDDSSADKSPSPTTPTSKRVCMYDEYAASCSSSDFSFKKTEQPVQKRKLISISTLTENPKEPKQVKLINAETQTIIDEAKESSVETTSKEEESKETANSENTAKQKKIPLKIFDDAPLERIRKNRLSALMGSLTGKEPVLLPKPDYASVLNSVSESPVNPIDSEDTDSDAEMPKSTQTEKPLISILSSPKRPSPTKSNKHVHFSVPESTSQTDGMNDSLVNSPANSSSSLTMASAFSANDTSNSVTETPAPPSSPVGLHPSAGDMAVVPITFGSGTGSNSSSTTSIVSKESSSSVIAVNSSKTDLTVPTFQFNPPTTSATLLFPTVTPTSQLPFSPSTTASIASITTPPKMGGFKFDLTKPVTSVTTTSSTVPTFSFGGSSQANSNKLNPSFENTIATTNIQSSTKSFNFVKSAIPTTTSTYSISNGPSFGIKTVASSISTPTTLAAVTTFKFGSGGSESKSASAIGASLANTPAPPVSSSTTFKFGSSASNDSKSTVSTGFPLAHSNAATFASSGNPPPAFGTNLPTTQQSNPPAVSAPSFGTSKSSFFSFGASKPASISPPGFGMSTSTTPALPSFGTPTTTFASNTGSTTTSSFLSASPATFGVVSTTSSSLGSGFGSPVTTFGSSSVFGTNKPASPFSVSNSATTPGFGAIASTTSPPFGKSNTPQFGQSTTQGTFGTATTTVSFGAGTTTSSAVFGNVNNSSVFGGKGSGFGASSGNPNIFGGAVITQSSGFGTDAQPSNAPFGMATTSAPPPFGTSSTTTTPSFGGNSAPTFNFGSKTTASSSFGTGNSFGTTTTASGGFGTSATPTFGSSNSFAGGGANTFGSTTAPAFGVTATTTQSGGFGTTTTPSFGTASSGFNTGDKNSVFGSSSTAPTFGNTSSPFGSSSGFGAPTSTSGFGNVAFGKPQTAENAFGAPASNNTFGTNTNFGGSQAQAASFGSANASNTQNAVFSFGATNTPKPPGVFSFGAGSSSEIPKPTFNFSGGNAAPPAFGSSTTPAFGNNNLTGFATTGIPQFNAPQTGAQGMFSIGSGSSTGKSRTHLKPKRRT